LIHLVNKRCRYSFEEPKPYKILTLFDMRPTLTLFSFFKGETAFGFDKLRASDSKDVDRVRESEILSDLNPI